MSMIRVGYFLAALVIAADVVTVRSFSVSSSTNNQRVFVSTPTTPYPKRKVADCMTSHDLITLNANDSVDEAMGKLLRNSVSGAPVVDHDNVLIGIVSSFDFLQQEAFEGALLPMEGSRDQIEKYVFAAQKICGQTVRDIMSPSVQTLTRDVPMRVAAEIMSTAKLHRLPVVDQKNKLVGILSAADVMRDLLHIARNLPPGKENESESMTSP
jgi:CBS domain-containing protein